MLDWSQCPSIERDLDRLSGAWVFRGTRVPATALFENLQSGARLDEFIEWFPGVTREQAEGVLEHVARSLLVKALFDQGTPVPPDITPRRRIAE